MYCKVVFLCLVASVRAAPAATDVVPLEKQQPTVIPIVSQSDELESNGTYKFSYETGNGIKREESSYTKVLPKVEGRSADSNEGGESDESNEIHVQEGSYSYTAPDGTLISVRYIADENGFRPVGDHIPQSVVAAAAAAGSSSEKSGRALNVGDSETSASKPKPVASAPKSAAAPAPPAPPAAEPEEKHKAVPESAPAEPSEASTTVATQPTESEATTENASEASPSTTEAASTANASSEATDASEGTTAADATTKAADATAVASDATTVAASEEHASTSADASTTEATTAAA